MQVLAVLIPGVLMAMGVVKIAGQGGEPKGRGNGKDWLVLGLLAAGAGAQVGMVSSFFSNASRFISFFVPDLLSSSFLYSPSREKTKDPLGTLGRTAKGLRSHGTRDFFHSESERDDEERFGLKTDSRRLSNSLSLTSFLPFLPTFLTSHFSP